uniref:RAP2C, member of RAS onco family n=1 Tax=Equus caballus TaxID=9796 RepID=A0A9L0SZS9_HORSE
RQDLKGKIGIVEAGRSWKEPRTIRSEGASESTQIRRGAALLQISTGKDGAHYGLNFLLTRRHLQTKQKGSAWDVGRTGLVFFPRTWKDIKPMRDQIVRVKRYEKVPLILVGNKVDLEPEREVMSSEGRALAQEWGCPFMETSAKSKSMVDELFAEIVRQMNYSSLPEKQDQCCTTCVVQ